MAQLFENIETNFNLFVQYCILLVEVIGVCVLIGTVIRAAWQLINKNPHVRLDLAQGIALSLEFKLGSEVLRTVIAREKSELIILGAIIALRGLLTFLIHWEIKTEEQRSEEQRLKEQEESTSSLDKKSEDEKSTDEKTA